MAQQGVERKARRLFDPAAGFFNLIRQRQSSHPRSTVINHQRPEGFHLNEITTALDKANRSSSRALLRLLLRQQFRLFLGSQSISAFRKSISRFLLIAQLFFPIFKDDL